nr:DUF748 domain-containing protein [Vibrio ichthyoenteri]
MSIKIKAAINQFRSFHPGIRWGVYTASAYLLYASVVGLAVPHIAKQQIPEQVSTLIERPVTLGDIRINPFTLQLDIDHFAIWETVSDNNIDDKVFIKFDHAGVKLNFWQSIFNGAVSVEYIQLDKPYINLERLNNQDELLFNFSDIVASVARNTATTEQPEVAIEEADDRHAPLFPVQIKQTSLTQGDVRLLDGVTGTLLHYPNINIALGEFSTQSLLSDSDNKNHYTLQIADADDATIELSGQVQLKPLEVAGVLDVKHIQLPRLWGLIAEQIQAELTSGEVNFSSNYHLAQTIGQTQAEDTMSISTSKGMFAINQLDFAHNGKSLVALQNIAVNDIATNVEEQTVNIGSLTSQGLKVVANVDKNGVDLVSLFTPSNLMPVSQQDQSSNDKVAIHQAQETSANSHDASAQSAPPWLVRLNGISIQEYQLNVTEKVATKKANQWVIAPINLTTSQIVSDFSQPIDFTFSTDVNSKGPSKSQAKPMQNSNRYWLTLTFNL